MTQRPDFRAHLKGKPQDMNKKNPAPQTTDDSRWQAVTALILAILGIYFVWAPGLNFILGLLALFFGIRGLRSQEKVASITAIIVSAFNIFGSLLVIAAVAVILRLFGWGQAPAANPQSSDYHFQSNTQQTPTQVIKTKRESSNEQTTRGQSTSNEGRRRSNSVSVETNTQEQDLRTFDDEMMIEFPPQFLLLNPEEWQSIVESEEYTVPLRTPEDWR